MQLTALSLCKTFGPVVANDAVDVELTAGEVHVLLGENGAGKSTTVGILAGRVAPDSGVIAIDGDAFLAGDPRVATAAGITAVYQESMLVRSLTAMQNARVATRRGRHGVKKEDLRARIEETMERYDLHVDFDTPVGALVLADRQKVELVWALAQEPRVLLLDEPTGLLPPLGATPFLKRLGRLAEEGMAVAMVTHRLAEVRMVADRVTVMRKGQVVGRFTRSTLPSDDVLTELIVGGPLIDRSLAAASVDGSTADAKPVLEVVALTIAEGHYARKLRGVSLQLRPGEIVGLAGIDGNGQESLLEAVAGLRARESGSVTLAGTRIESWPYRRRARAGISFVSGDRRRYGIFPRLTVAENLQVGVGARKTEVDEMFRTLGIYPSDPDYRADQLSGGNQQKVVLGRALLARPRVLLLSYPLRGLDIAASRSVRMLLSRAAATGVAIVVAASDLEELFSICDRVLVMDRGSIVDDVSRSAFDAQRIGALLTTS